MTAQTISLFDIAAKYGVIPAKVLRMVVTQGEPTPAGITLTRLIADIAHFCGCSDRTIKTALRLLATMGYVHVIHTGRASRIVLLRKVVYS